MPTMYRWDYDDPDEADPVLQGAYAGDIAHDDGLGEDGVINFLEGAYLNMTFELEGEKVTKNRTFGHIRGAAVPIDGDDGAELVAVYAIAERLGKFAHEVLAMPAEEMHGWIVYLNHKSRLEKAHG